MAKKWNFGGIIRFLESVFQNDELMWRFGFSLLEKNVKAIIDMGQLDVIEYMNAGTSSREAYVKTTLALHKLEEIDSCMRSLESCSAYGKWDWIAGVARELPEQDGIRDYAAQLLEGNACDILADGDKDAIAFLFKNASSERVKRMMFDSLLKAGDIEAIRAMLGKKETEKDWEWVMKTGESFPDLKEQAIKILERNASHVMRNGSSDCLLFLGLGTGNAGIRSQTISTLAGVEKAGAVHSILDYMAQRSMWKELLDTAKRHGGSKTRIIGLFERDFHAIVAKGEVDSLAFLYCSSKEGSIGRRLVEGLCRNKRMKPAGIILGLMARKEDWNALMIEAAFPGNPDALRSQAYSLLEQDYKKVVRSGDPEAIGYLAHSSSNGKVLESILDWSSDQGNAALAKQAMEHLAAIKEWNLLIDKIYYMDERSRIRMQGLAILERDIHKVCNEAQHGSSLIRFWKATGSDEMKGQMLGILSRSARAEQTKQLLDSIAHAKEFAWLEYFEKIAKRPDLRRYASYLLEKNRNKKGIRSVLGDIPVLGELF